MQQRRKSGSVPLVIAFASLLILGIPVGLLGVAWPTMQRTFGVSVDALGVLLIGLTVGYASTSFASGQLITQYGRGKVLSAAGALFCVGLFAQASAQSWLWLIVAVLCTGIASGAIDSAINGFLANNYGATILNWLQACFGLGATFGPLLMTIILQAGQSWRLGILLLACLQAMLAVAFVLSRRKWLDQPLTALDGTAQPAAARVPLQRTAAIPAMWVMMALYLLFAGVESTPGQWSYILFTQARAIPNAAAGIWVSVYWGSLTAGRMILGIAADRYGTIRISRICVIGILAGALVLWWDPIPMSGWLGLAIIGFAEAPLYASILAYTPKLFGPRHAPNAIGLQMGTNGLAYAIVPALVGVLATRTTFEIIGPAIFIFGAGMLALLPAIARPLLPSQLQDLTEAGLGSQNS
jgi:MFS family permease